MKKFCGRHKLELSSYCESCLEGICWMCYNVHKGHSIQALQYIFPKYKSLVITNVIPKLMKGNVDLESAYTELKERVRTIKKNRDGLRENVYSSVNTIFKILEKKKDMIMEEIWKNVTYQINHSERAISQVLGLLDDVKDSLTNAHNIAYSEDVSYLLSYKSLCKRMTDLDKSIQECIPDFPGTSLGDLRLSDTKLLFDQIQCLQLLTPQTAAEEKKREKGEVNNSRKRKLGETGSEKASTEHEIKKTKTACNTGKEGRSITANGNHNTEAAALKVTISKPCKINLRYKKDMLNTQAKQSVINLNRRNDNHGDKGTQRQSIFYGDFSMFSDNLGNLDLLEKDWSHDEDPCVRGRLMNNAKKDRSGSTQTEKQSDNIQSNTLSEKPDKLVTSSARQSEVPSVTSLGICPTVQCSEKEPNTEINKEHNECPSVPLSNLETMRQQSEGDTDTLLTVKQEAKDEGYQEIKQEPQDNGQFETCTIGDGVKIKTEPIWEEPTSASANQPMDNGNQGEIDSLETLRSGGHEDDADRRTDSVSKNRMSVAPQVRSSDDTEQPASEHVTQDMGEKDAEQSASEHVTQDMGEKDDPKVGLSNSNRSGKENSRNQNQERKRNGEESTSMDESSVKDAISQSLKLLSSHVMAGPSQNKCHDENNNQVKAGNKKYQNLIVTIMNEYHGGQNDQPPYNNDDNADLPPDNHEKHNDQPLRNHGDQKQPLGNHCDQTLPLSNHGDHTQQPLSNHGDNVQQPFSGHGDHTQQPLSNHGDNTQQPLSNHGDQTDKPLCNDKAQPLSNHDDHTDQPTSNQRLEDQPLDKNGEHVDQLHTKAVGSMDLHLIHHGTKTRSTQTTVIEYITVDSQTKCIKDVLKAYVQQIRDQRQNQELSVSGHDIPVICNKQLIKTTPSRPKSSMGEPTAVTQHMAKVRLSSTEQPSASIPAAHIMQTKAPSPAANIVQPFNATSAAQARQHYDQSPADNTEQPFNATSAAQARQHYDQSPAAQVKQHYDQSPAANTEQPFNAASASQISQSYDQGSASQISQSYDQGSASQMLQSSHQTYPVSYNNIVPPSTNALTITPNPNPQVSASHPCSYQQTGVGGYAVMPQDMTNQMIWQQQWMNQTYQPLWSAGSYTPPVWYSGQGYNYYTVQQAYQTHIHNTCIPTASSVGNVAGNARPTPTPSVSRPSSAPTSTRNSFPDVPSVSGNLQSVQKQVCERNRTNVFLPTRDVNQPVKSKDCPSIHEKEQPVQMKQNDQLTELSTQQEDQPLEAVDTDGSQSESESDEDSDSSDEETEESSEGEAEKGDLENPISIDEDDTDEIEVTGTLLERYKSGRKRNLQLTGVTGNLVEFALDSQGSHFLQSKIMQTNGEKLMDMMREILHSRRLVELLGNAYSCRVIKAIITQAAYEKCKYFLRWLCFDEHGSFAMLKVFNSLQPDMKKQILSLLDGSILRLIKDKIGHVIILKCVEAMTPGDLQSLIKMCTEHVESLSFDKHGSLVLQKIISRMKAAAIGPLMEAVLDHGNILIQDQNGILVLNRVVEKGAQQTAPKIVSWLKKGLIHNCCNGTISAIVVKSLLGLHKDQCSELIKDICLTKDSAFLEMLTNKHGIAVLQCMLGVAKPHHRRILMKKMQPHQQLLTENSLWKDFTMPKN